MVGEDIAAANEAASSFPETLRGWLDGWFGLQDFFADLSCHIQGTFLGYENITCIFTGG
ncbi:MAG: hypothetical protein GTO02_10565 [Candidatus Dadabacteria bacterium]|nr:hypothetical protein [Candidatus Dadabacteria bacterium]